MSLANGERVPDFSLRDQHGATTTLSSYRGEKAVVVMFYPYAFSRVCTGELCEIRDNLPTFESDHVQVLAISCDPVHSLRAFAEQDRLSFPLLSDFWPHGEVSKTYGVFNEKRGCPDRSTCIVDRDGVLRWSVHNEMPEARDLEAQAKVLADL